MMKYGIHQTPKEMMRVIAANVRKLRKIKRMTQKELSDRSGVAYASIKKFETTGIISLESLLKLCNSLDRLSEFESILQLKDIERKSNLFDI